MMIYCCYQLAVHYYFHILYGNHYMEINYYFHIFVIVAVSRTELIVDNIRM